MLFAVFLGVAFPCAGQFEECGELMNAYGPFDYRTQRDKLYIVEGAHFTQDVEGLRRGASGTIGSDIDYTLRASPNHHRALIAMANLGRKLNTEQPQGAKYTVACYFDRAIRFAKDDSVVRLVYGTYLARAGKRAEAVQQLELADSLDPNNANVHYNLGLLYLEMKDYPKARENARRAYALGFTLPGLKKKLEEAGQWEESAGGSKAAGRAPAGDSRVAAPK
jgi:tetratricopeptide (TPR) repeat protein